MKYDKISGKRIGELFRATHGYGIEFIGTKEIDFARAIEKEVHTNLQKAGNRDDSLKINLRSSNTPDR